MPSNRLVWIPLINAAENNVKKDLRGIDFKSWELYAYKVKRCNFFSPICIFTITELRPFIMSFPICHTDQKTTFTGLSLSMAIIINCNYDYNNGVNAKVLSAGHFQCNLEQYIIISRSLVLKRLGKTFRYSCSPFHRSVCLSKDGRGWHPS